MMSCISTNWVCDLGAAVADADMAARYFEATSSGFVGFRVGPNPGVVANAAAGLLKWTAGSPDAAVASMQRALDLAVDLDHPYSHAFALHHVTLLDYWRHDIAAVRAHAEESQRVAAAHGYAVWAALALVFHGIAAVADGDCDRGIDEMEQGFERYEGLATPPIFWPALLAIRAATHATAGNVDRALVLIDEAWRDLGDHPVTAELELAHGDILLAAPDPDHGAAARHFERAAEHSAGRGARMLELQSLTRLATHVADTPTDPTVRSRLRALYDTFDEGFDTPQLRAAARGAGRTRPRVRTNLIGALPGDGAADAAPRIVQVSDEVRVPSATQLRRWSSAASWLVGESRQLCVEIPGRGTFGLAGAGGGVGASSAASWRAAMNSDRPRRG